MLVFGTASTDMFAVPVPGQIGVYCISFGIVAVFTSMLMEVQTELPHDPEALTKYVAEAVGVMVMLLPVPTWLEPQNPLNHFQEAPVPRVPPFTESVMLCPGHTEVALALMDAGATDPQPLSYVITTVSLDGVQLPFDIVHTSMLLPAFKPETVAEAKLELLMPPVKLTIVQLPVPTVGLFAARVYTGLKTVRSAPASAVVGWGVTLTEMGRLFAVHPLDPVT